MSFLFNKMIEKKTENKYIIATFCVFWVFSIIRISNYYTFCNGDDFGYIANAAFFADYNWNPYTGLQTIYFGYGFSILPAITFKLGLKSVYVYRLLLAFIELYRAVILFLLYRIIHKYVGVDSRDASMISFVCSVGIFSPQCGVYFLSEVPYALSFVLVIYLLIVSIDACRTKKIFYSITVGAVIGYSYTIHARMLVSFVVMLLLTLWYYWTSKKRIIYLSASMISLLITAWIGKIGANYLQNTLYNSKTGITSNMDSIKGNEALTRLTYLKDYIKIFSSIKYIKSFVRHYCSLLSTFYAITGGLIVLLLIVLIPFVVKYMHIDNTKESQSLALLINGGLIGFMGMNFLIAINGAMEYNNSRFLVYFRYAQPFICLMLAGFLILYQKNLIINIQYLRCAFFIAIIKLFLTDIIPRQFTRDWLTIPNVEHLSCYFFEGEDYYSYFRKLFLISTLLFIFVLFCMKKNNLYILLLSIIIINVPYMYSEDTYYTKISKERYDGVQETEEFVRNTNTDIDVYYLQGSYSGRLRFSLYDYKMQYLLEIDEIESIDFKNAILLSDKPLQYIAENIDNVPKYVIELGECQYVYTSNKEYYYKNKHGIR